MGVSTPPPPSLSVKQFRTPPGVVQAEPTTCVDKLVQQTLLSFLPRVSLTFAGSVRGLMEKEGAWGRSQDAPVGCRAGVPGGGGAGEPAGWAWGVHLYVTLEFAASRE